MSYNVNCNRGARTFGLQTFGLQTFGHRTFGARLIGLYWSFTQICAVVGCVPLTTDYITNAVFYILRNKITYKNNSIFTYKITQRFWLNRGEGEMSTLKSTRATGKETILVTYFTIYILSFEPFLKILPSLIDASRLQLRSVHFHRTPCKHQTYDFLILIVEKTFLSTN